MIRLRGKSVVPGMALGVAKKLRAGDLELPPSGTPDLILVTDSYSPSLAVLLSLLKNSLAGVAIAQEPEAGWNFAVPAVAGIAPLLEAVQDGDILLLDGDYGFLLIDPDVASIAHYQADRERVAPRHRVYLDYAHQPARTLHGAEIHVLARVTTMQEVTEAVANGADGLHIPENSPLLPADAEDEEQLDTLAGIVNAAPGKPLTLVGDANSLSIEAAVRAAARAALILAVPVEEDAEELTRLADYARETGQALAEEGIAVADLRMALFLRPGEALPESLAELPVARIVLDDGAGIDLSAPGVQDWVTAVAEEARGLLLPVEIAVASDDEAQVTRALLAGASGLIASPGAIQAIKDRIRNGGAEDS